MFLRRAFVAISIAALLAACAPVPAQTPTAAPYARVTEREYFTRGAMYGCSGIIIGMAQLFQIPPTEDMDFAILMLCRTYAERVTVAVWDNGIPAQEGEPPIVVPSPSDPL